MFLHRPRCSSIASIKYTENYAKNTILELKPFPKAVQIASINLLGTIRNIQRVVKHLNELKEVSTIFTNTEQAYKEMQYVRAIVCEQLIHLNLIKNDINLDVEKFEMSTKYEETLLGEVDQQDKLRSTVTAEDPCDTKENALFDNFMNTETETKPPTNDDIFDDETFNSMMGVTEKKDSPLSTVSAKDDFDFDNLFKLDISLEDIGVLCHETGIFTRRTTKAHKSASTISICSFIFRIDTDEEKTECQKITERIKPFNLPEENMECQNDNRKTSSISSCKTLILPQNTNQLDCNACPTILDSQEMECQNVNRKTPSLSSCDTFVPQNTDQLDGNACPTILDTQEIDTNENLSKDKDFIPPNLDEAGCNDGNVDSTNQIVEQSTNDLSSEDKLPISISVAESINTVDCITPQADINIEIEALDEISSPCDVPLMSPSVSVSTSSTGQDLNIEIETLDETSSPCNVPLMSPSLSESMSSTGKDVNIEIETLDETSSQCDVPLMSPSLSESMSSTGQDVNIEMETLDETSSQCDVPLMSPSLSESMSSTGKDVNIEIETLDETSSPCDVLLMSPNVKESSSFGVKECIATELDVDTVKCREENISPWSMDTVVLEELPVSENENSQDCDKIKLSLPESKSPTLNLIEALDTNINSNNESILEDSVTSHCSNKSIASQASDTEVETEEINGTLPKNEIILESPELESNAIEEANETIDDIVHKQTTKDSDQIVDNGEKSVEKMDLPKTELVELINSKDNDDTEATDENNTLENSVCTSVKDSDSEFSENLQLASSENTISYNVHADDLFDYLGLSSTGSYCNGLLKANDFEKDIIRPSGFDRNGETVQNDLNTSNESNKTDTSLHTKNNTSHGKVKDPDLAILAAIGSDSDSTCSISDDESISSIDQFVSNIKNEDNFNHVQTPQKRTDIIKESGCKECSVQLDSDLRTKLDSSANITFNLKKLFKKDRGKKRRRNSSGSVSKSKTSKYVLSDIDTDASLSDVDPDEQALIKEQENSFLTSVDEDVGYDSPPNNDDAALLNALDDEILSLDESDDEEASKAKKGPSTSATAIKEENDLDKSGTSKTKHKTAAWKRDSLLTYNVSSDSDSSICESGMLSAREMKKFAARQAEIDGFVKVLENSTRKERRSSIILTDTDSDSDSEIDASQTKGRKNIREVLDDENLDEATKLAKREENDRVNRLKHKQKTMESYLSQSQSQSEEPGGLVLDADETTLVVVNKDITNRLKKHQIEGVHFMWDCCFESVKRLREHPGSGCILAHCMGLGKTFQVVALIDTLFTHPITNTKHVLILCPLSTVLNWENEFKIGLGTRFRKNMNIFLISDTQRDKKHRLYVTECWRKETGVLIMGYEGYMTLTTFKKDENGKDTPSETIIEALVKPGPDLVICDEGHLLKNGKTNRTKALMKINTKRRIILTGTPLQNNLKEYYHMVEFVKPSLLGTYKEYTNRFVNPIVNGQYDDSTKEDIILMKQRSHVLHSMLKDTIQRYEVAELQSYLPPKVDYVLFVNLHPIQAELYQKYIASFPTKDKGKLFSHFHQLQASWTHPLLLKLKDAVVKKKIVEIDTINIDGAPPIEEATDSLPKGWWKQHVPENFEHCVEHGSKFAVMISILEKCEKINDKVLLFTSNIQELNAIEHFLNAMNKPMEPKKWDKGASYLRMDGTVNPDTRMVYCNQFNDKKSKIRLFLISHKVGGLGLNLVAANRVILMDVSWNPSFDSQSIFRVYRFGQTKECFIYRLVSRGTMEEVVYERSVTKQAIAGRVVDELQISRHYKSNDLQLMYRNNINLDEVRPNLPVPVDSVLADIYFKHKEIFSYHCHENLLQNLPHEELGKEDMELAWVEYNKEKDRENAVPAPPPTINLSVPSHMLSAVNGLNQQMQAVYPIIQTPYFNASNTNNNEQVVISSLEGRTVKVNTKTGHVVKFNGATTTPAVATEVFQTYINQVVKTRVGPTNAALRPAIPTATSSSRHIVPPNNTGLRPVIPTATGVSRYIVPPNNTGLRPAIPTATGISRHIVPPNNTGLRPGIPTATGVSRYLVPPNNTGLRPAIPTATGISRHIVPPNNTRLRPAVPAATGVSRYIVPPNNFRIVHPINRVVRPRMPITMDNSRLVPIDKTLTPVTTAVDVNRYKLIQPKTGMRPGLFQFKNTAGIRAETTPPLPPITVSPDVIDLNRNDTVDNICKNKAITVTQIISDEPINVENVLNKENVGALNQHMNPNARKGVKRKASDIIEID